MHRRLLAAPALLLVAACGGGHAHGPVTRSGVTVKASLDKSALAVTFTPKAGFHLYSTDLPQGGVDGVGLATTVTVGGSLHATGPATADQQVHTITVAGVNGDVPVYPSGPVTLRIPVTEGSGAAKAVVQFASCSDTICLPPVQTLSIPVG